VRTNSPNEKRYKHPSTIDSLHPEHEPTDTFDYLDSQKQLQTGFQADIILMKNW
jgi:hypothetical protein